MLKKSLRFDIVEGSTEHITFNGQRIRRPTVLIRVGGFSLSKKAFLLGSVLVVFQILDGLLTFIGLSMMGVHMEGNTFLRALIRAYGAAPALFAVKTLAIVFVVVLTLHAHKRKWIRPLIASLIVIYFTFAVFPWTYLISKTNAEAGREQPLDPGGVTDTQPNGPT